MKNNTTQTYYTDPEPQPFFDEIVLLGGVAEYRNLHERRVQPRLLIFETTPFFIVP